MSSCCPICYRGSEGQGKDDPSSRREAATQLLEDDGHGRELEVEQRFFRLFQRYLNGGEEGEKLGGNGNGASASSSLFPLEELPEMGMGGCGGCRNLMEEFCDLYHQLRTIQLKINWRVQKFKEVMKGAQRVPVRMKCFRDFMGKVELEKEAEGRRSRWGSGNELIKAVIKSRKCLIENCSRKVRNTFPKLHIEKWKPPKSHPNQNVESSAEVSQPQPCSGASAEVTGVQETTKEGLPSHVEERYSELKKILSSSPVAEDPIGRVIGDNAELEIGTWRKRKVSSGDFDGDLGADVGAPLNKQVCFEVDQTLPHPEDNHDEDAEWASQDDAEAAIQDQDDVTSSQSDQAATSLALISVPVSPKSELPIGKEFARSHPDLMMELADEPMACPIDHEVDLVQRNENNPEFEFPTDGPSTEPVEKKLIVTNTNTTNLENITATHPGRKSGLRSTHICPRCRKTFSSDERMQLHTQEAHGDIESENEDVEEGAVEEDGRDEDEGDNDNGSMSWISSSSEDEFEIDLEPDEEMNLMEADPLEGQEEVTETGQFSTDLKPSIKRDVPSRKLAVPPSPKDKKKENHIRLKCPDCGIFFLDAAALLFHRQHSAPCSDSYDPTTTIRVEVFALPKGRSWGSTNEAKFSITWAVIELSQEMLVCDSDKIDGGCGGLAFYSWEELVAHRKLHGTFQCKFCKVTKSYAPDLSIHEHENHATEMKRYRRGRTRKIFNCPRCQCQSGWSRSSKCKKYISHHLSRHLNLTYREPLCPICKNAGNLFHKHQLKSHLKRFHDLTSITSPEDIERCGEDNCSAYFRTKSQLKDHQRLCHDRSSKSKANFRFKCPGCSDLFWSVNDFLFHRMESESCGPFYDVTKSVKVDLMGLAPPKDSTETGDTGTTSTDVNNEPNFTHRLATIDLPQELHQCKRCDLILYSSEDMEAHRKLHGRFPCNFCKVKKNYAPNLAKHELRHAKDKIERNKEGKASTINCPRCDFKLSQCSGGRHLYVHHHLKSHLTLTLNEPKCPICKGMTPLLSHEFNPLEHFRTHHDLSHISNPKEDLHRCTADGCQAYFVKRWQLLNHLEFRHGKERKRKWECKDCGRRFATPNSLRNHRLNFHAETMVTFPCVFENCPKVFENKEDLLNHFILGRAQKHKPLDDPSKEVQCPECQASFSGMNPNLLYKHIIANHTKKVAYVCETCGYVCHDQPRFALHNLVHSGPASWEYLCQVCSKKCISKQKLEEHMWTHTKEKRFACQVCGAKYAHRHNLRLHVNNKHGDQVQDIPRKKNMKNCTSRKGIKRKDGTNYFTSKKGIKRKDF